MNSLSYYDRIHYPWTDEELAAIRQQYNEQKMDVIQMGNIHRKTPGQVAYRLKQIGVVSKDDVVRGYIEYRQSDLFRESKINATSFKKELKKRDTGCIKNVKDDKIISTCQEKRGERRKEILRTIAHQKEMIEELTTEVKSIKNDIKEILRLMNEIYDFESQQ